MKWLVKDKCKVINSYTLMQQRDCVLCQTADQFVLLSHLHEAFCRGYSSWGSLFWNRNCNLLIIGCADYRLQSKIQLQLFSQNSILTLFSKLSIIFFLNVALVHLHTSQNTDKLTVWHAQCYHHVSWDYHYIAFQCFSTSTAVETSQQHCVCWFSHTIQYNIIQLDYAIISLIAHSITLAQPYPGVVLVLCSQPNGKQFDGRETAPF